MYTEFLIDCAVCGELLRMNADPQSNLYGRLPHTAVKHLQRLASNVPTQPGPRGCDEEVTA